MNRSLTIACAAAGVAALLLGGAYLLSDREPPAASAAAPLTTLTWPPDPSDGRSAPPDPYPAVPSTQIEAGDRRGTRARTGNDGRHLLLPVSETDCSREEVWLLGEHADRVELEIRRVVKPLPPSASVAPDGTYGCVSFGSLNGPHAVVELRAPLGDRRVVVRETR